MSASAFWLFHVFGNENIPVNEETEFVEEVPPSGADDPSATPEPYIKWVQFDASYEMLTKALEYDVKSFGKEVKLDWVTLLAYSVSKNWGNVNSKCLKDMDDCVKQLNAGKTIEDLTAGMKLYPYYFEAYNAILGNFVGEFDIEVPDDSAPSKKKIVKKYGLKAFSPVARGYNYSHYDDFGVGRSYGYKRKHMGNDLVGSVGAPIIAVEGGIIEALGWNQYGGWRVGIRSFDQKRYYYYAHLRKNHPFHKSLKVGDTVKPGDVIGYLGMTGYSSTENVNNITTPHLHFGLQLIFNEVQKEGINQIWVDVYQIVRLLSKNKTAVSKDPETKDFTRIYDIFIPD